MFVSSFYDEDKEEENEGKENFVNAYCASLYMYDKHPKIDSCVSRFGKRGKCLFCGIGYIIDFIQLTKINITIGTHY